MELEEGQTKRIGRASFDFHLRNPDGIRGTVRARQIKSQANKDAAAPLSAPVSGQLRERQSDIRGDRICGATRVLFGQDPA